MHRHQAHATHIKKHASKRLRINLRILFIVYAVLFAVTTYSVIISKAIWWQVLLGLFIGLIAGLISSRMYKISWSKDEAKVVGKIDIYGFAVLLLFIIFELNRSHIAMLFSSGSSLGAIGFTLITGALFGRIFGTARQIIRVLKSENIIKRHA
jgi:hypothetical protein